MDPTGHDPVCGYDYSDPECKSPSDDPVVINNPGPLDPGLPQGGGGGSSCNIFTSNCNPSGGSGGYNTLASCTGGSGGSGGTGGRNSGSGGGGGNGGSCNTLASCVGNNSTGGGGHPLASPHPDDIIGCSLFDCALSAVSLIATVVAAVPGTIGLVGFGVDLVATVWAIGRTNDDYRQGEISKTRQYALNISGGVGVLPGGLLGEWAFPVSFVASLANLLMTATGLPN